MKYNNIEDMLEEYKQYTKYFIKIPTDFTVKDDYLLDGISKSEFITAFIDYQKLIISIYEDIIKKPDKYGLFKYDKKANSQKPAYDIDYPVLWLFTALGLASEITDRSMIVNGVKFSEYLNGKKMGVRNAKPANIDKLFDRLQDFGFIYKELNLGNIKDFTVSLPDNKNILVAVKACTMSNCTYSSLLSDIKNFNYKIFSVGVGEQLNFEDLFCYNLLKSEHQKFIVQFIAAMKAAGYNKYNEWFKDTLGSGKIYYPNKCSLYFSPNGVDMSINRHDSEKYFDYVKTLSERYRKYIVIPCKGCRKECGYRYKGVVLDKQGSYCHGAAHTFPTGIEDIPYIIELINIYSNKKM